VKHQLEVTALKGGNVPVGAQKAVKAFGTPYGPLVFHDIVAGLQLREDIAGKYGGSGVDDLSLSAYVYLPLWKIKGKAHVGMESPEQLDIFFFTPGFYLKSVIIHQCIVSEKR
jgi:hypothetical protein